MSFFVTTTAGCNNKVRHSQLRRIRYKVFQNNATIRKIKNRTLDATSRSMRSIGTVVKEEDDEVLNSEQATFSPPREKRNIPATVTNLN